MTVRGRHYPRQNRMEATARMNAAGKVRTQHVMTEKEAALDNALKLYFAARAEAIATGGKRPFIDDFTKGL